MAREQMERDILNPVSSVEPDCDFETLKNGMQRRTKGLENDVGNVF